MAKKKSSGLSAGRATPGGELVPLNPWIPAIPVKMTTAKGRGKTMVKLVLGLPLVLTAGTASGEPLPNRTLHVPIELTRQSITIKDFDKVLLLKDALLGQYEARIILVQKRGGRGK